MPNSTTLAEVEAVRADHAERRRAATLEAQRCSCGGPLNEHTPAQVVTCVERFVSEGER